MAKSSKRKLSQGQIVYVIDGDKFGQNNEICIYDGEIVSIDKEQNLVLIGLFCSQFKSFNIDKFGKLFFDTLEGAEKMAAKIPLASSLVWILKEDGTVSSDVVKCIKEHSTENGWDLEIKFEERNPISVEKIGKEIFIFKESAKARYKAKNEKISSNKTVEDIVEKALHKIINGGTNISFIEQLEELNIYINSNEECPEEERKDAFPDFWEYSLNDLKKIKRYLGIRIADELEYYGYSFLETMRMCIAIIKLSEALRIRHRHEKVQFCLSFWSLSRDVGYSLRKISLLDKI